MRRTLCTTVNYLFAARLRVHKKCGALLRVPRKPTRVVPRFKLSMLGKCDDTTASGFVGDYDRARGRPEHGYVLNERRPPCQAHFSGGISCGDVADGNACRRAARTPRPPAGPVDPAEAPAGPVLRRAVHRVQLRRHSRRLLVPGWRPPR